MVSVPLAASRFTQNAINDIGVPRHCNDVTEARYVSVHYGEQWLFEYLTPRKSLEIRTAIREGKKDGRKEARKRKERRGIE